jgi:hypothetical protein
VHPCTCTQIGRAVYGGPYIDLLESLAREQKLLLIRQSPKTATDESDQELILRFLALKRVGGMFTGARLTSSWRCSYKRWPCCHTALSNTPGVRQSGTPDDLPEWAPHPHELPCVKRAELRLLYRCRFHRQVDEHGACGVPAAGRWQRGGAGRLHTTGARGLCLEHARS